MYEDSTKYHIISVSKLWRGGIMNLYNFMNEIDETILNRGLRYFKDGHVLGTKVLSNGWVEVLVVGHDDYTVSVQLADDGTILKANCACPYRGGPICKHEVAAFYSLSHSFTPKESPLASLLKSLPMETLVAELLKVADENPMIYERLMAYQQPHDQLATFEENYNFPYYKEFLDTLGYKKDVDYLSFQIGLPEKTDPRIVRIGETIMKRYNLRIATAKNKNDYIKKYKDGIFEVLNEAYGDLYGVIPYNEKLKKQIIDQFNLIIKLEYLVTILDENDRVVAFGFGIPSIAKAVQKSKGKLLPFGVFRILHAKNNCSLADFGLIGVRKEYQGKGVTAIILNYIVENAKKVGVVRVETNHSLEDNHKIIATWKNFEDVTQHKRFRVFTKNISNKKIIK